MTAARIQVLGPMQVLTDHGVVVVSGHCLKTFLGALTISVNHAVRVDTLVQVVWGDEPPASLDTSVHSLATKVRDLLGHETVVLEDHSYCLFAECSDIDACIFERLTGRAEELLDADPESALATAHEALDLWRGPAYGDLGDVDPFRLEAIRLDQLRHAVTECLIAAELELGHTTRAIPILMTMLEETPYRERMWSLLLTALGRDGRRGEAIEAFRRYEALMSELGLEPSTDVCAALECALRP
jgi:DNA-binding SARP family transcriptional activator